jgi:hypothetical protein
MKPFDTREKLIFQLLQITASKEQLIAELKDVLLYLTKVITYDNYFSLTQTTKQKNTFPTILQITYSIVRYLPTTKTPLKNGIKAFPHTIEPFQTTFVLRRRF